MNLRDAIRKIAKDETNTRNLVAKVLAVDGSTCDVQIVDTEFELTGVRLQTETSSGVLLVPAIDSKVIISPIDDFEYVVIMYSAVSAIKFLNGSFGGMVKVQSLVSKLNDIEQKVNDIISWANAHVHSGNNVTPTTPYSGGNLTETERTDIENGEVTHGTV